MDRRVIAGRFDGMEGASFPFPDVLCGGTFLRHACASPAVTQVSGFHQKEYPDASCY